MATRDQNMSEAFELWLEFEQWQDNQWPTDYFNMCITLADGRRYAANVWVASGVERMLDEGRDLGGLHEMYAKGPDLVVRKAERPLLEAIVADMIARGTLPEEWRTQDGAQ